MNKIIDYGIPLAVVVVFIFGCVYFLDLVLVMLKIISFIAASGFVLAVGYFLLKLVYRYLFKKRRDKKYH